MSVPPFIPYQFRTPAGAATTIIYVFPTVEYEWESTQGYRNALMPIYGANRAYDLLQNALAMRDVGHERLRFTLRQANAQDTDLNTKIEELKAKVVAIGPGLFYKMNGALQMQYAPARATMGPQISYGSSDVVAMTIVLDFIRTGDWVAL